jgi:hypothetical protein
VAWPNRRVAVRRKLDINKTRLLATDLIALVRTQRVTVICIADLPPSPSSKSRYLIKRLRAALPELRIIIGRWSPAALADENTQALIDAGATLVATTMTETRAYFEGLVEIPRIHAPEGQVDPESKPQRPQRVA